MIKLQRYISYNRKMGCVLVTSYGVQNFSESLSLDSSIIYWPNFFI